MNKDIEYRKFNLPNQEPGFERVDVNRYIVKSFQGLFEAATHAFGHGISKLEYLCPESEHTNNVSGDYPRIVVFTSHPSSKYCARITLSVNERQLKDMQDQFNGVLG